MATALEKKQQPPSTFGVNTKYLSGKMKLVLCHVSTSKALKLHTELEPIMQTYGFVSVSDPDEDANSAWMEYIYPAAATTGDGTKTLPTPSLPRNRIDGLHMYTYGAFLDAVSHYLQVDNISDIFTVQRIPVQLPPDARLTWRYAKVGNEPFVYRAQTLKPDVFKFYDHQGRNGSSSSADGSGEVSSSVIDSRGMDDSISSIAVPLDYSIVIDDQNKNDSPDDILM